MRHISILVLRESVMASIADPRYMFTAVNEFLKGQGKPPMFTVQLVGLDREVRLNGDAFSIHTDCLLDDIKHTDLIFIPAISGDITQTLAMNEAVLPWINRHHRQGAEVASLCIGAFVLAATGLLDGKRCSTHWLFAHQFRTMFPSVELVDDRIITEENGVYTSGGAHSYWNLLLYLVEKYTNRDLAILASKYFAIDIGRNSQSPFMLFRGQRTHADDAIIKAQEFIEDHYQDKITVDDLSDKLGIGRRSLERRFKKATRNTVTEYIQRVKVEAAKKHFENTRKNITEVMYDVGYSDTKAFRDVFKKITGMSPLDYRNKYTKRIVVPARP